MIPLARPIIGEGEKQAVLRVLESGRLAQGAEVAAFEEEFAKTVDGRTCVAVSSGTSALLLALLAVGIGPGDEVIVPSFSFAASANAVRLCGADPVFVDIEPAHFTIDPAAVRAAIGPRTAALMPVHLYGHPAAMAELCALAEQHDLAMVEDAAQAHLATLDDRPLGTYGVAAFSFYATKNMTCGEGGMIVTDDEHTARQVRLLRNQGMERQYENEIAGYNARMTDLQAAIGRVQLSQLDCWTDTRRSNAAQFDAELVGVTTPPCAAGATHAYHQYTIRADDRDDLAQHLIHQGVQSAVYYPKPIHRLPAYDLPLSLPETERACREVLSLPVRPDLEPAEVAAIIEGVNTWR